MCRHANVPMCERRVWIDGKQNTSAKRQTAEKTHVGNVTVGQ